MLNNSTWIPCESCLGGIPLGGPPLPLIPLGGGLPRGPPLGGAPLGGGLPPGTGGFMLQDGAK